ncbi:unnamed protein product [Lathyrus oleraceus]
MTEILKFLYIMILFLFRTLTANKFNAFLKCDTELDCPPQMCYTFLKFFPKCVNHLCNCVRKDDLGQ